MLNKLIKKAKYGDKSAFSDLIHYYQNDLYRIAKTRLSQDEDIYDAIQETIISAYKSINKLHKISSFKSWLIKILINKCNDIYKNQSQFNSISFEAIRAENQTSYSEELTSNIELDSLMNSLNSDEKTILVLYYVEKYKSKEIAEMLSINESTVRSKILRAKKKLENNIKEEL